MIKRTCIRTDGGPNIGMGHIQRCVALAKELKKRDIEVFFISRRNDETKRKINQEGFKVIELEKSLSLKEDLKRTIKLLNAKRIHTLITDSYEFDEQYLLEAKKNISLLISIDDAAKTAFPSDIVFNGNIYAKDLSYSSLTSKTKFYLGPQYAILREEFAHVSKRGVNKKVENILITLGSTDSFNLTPKILNVLDAVDMNFKVTVVIGRFFNNFSEIKKLVKKLSREVNLFYDPTQMIDLMLASDLTISGGGVTLYELAATGTPTLAFCLADNQLRNVVGMGKAGIILNMGRGDKADMDGFYEKIIQLANDYELRKEMNKRGQKLVDGKGSYRCAEIIQRSNI